ncbi:hypothetical protein PtrM4_094670 [Pyrenophora tritici-repentis]|uniref:Uncharacterized protein n=1 Tax=Pyrenophora tritici-repentis TaxID=45151 RepID=A0A834S1P9_9PLEO|nr:hypothetical protein PtrM4_094670 [Pyrenophora tritici-repentis]KAI1517148.1 hypothetical protein Ptr86124_004085 [Pyrenophora tritici-repentis]KAI1670301.1 hypothetical protein L13192_05817 [Pyrenophora tritici-repentis]KAI1681918.1 hypothetical protein KJE20_08789 [Pyrenophora tritici-repentis]
MQDAMLHSDYIQQHQDVDLSEIVDRGFSNLDTTLRSTALNNRFQLSCDLPDSFVPMVRQITEGSSFIHFDGDAGELWDTASTRAASEDWSPQEFCDQWEWTVSDHLPLPWGGTPAYMKMYELQALRSASRPCIWESLDGTQSLTYHPETLASDDIFIRNRDGLRR